MKQAVAVFLKQNNISLLWLDENDLVKVVTETSDPVFTQAWKELFEVRHIFTRGVTEVELDQPTAGRVKDGKAANLRLHFPKTEDEAEHQKIHTWLQRRLPLLDRAEDHAHLVAVELSRLFSYDRRGRWVEIFLNIAHGGNGRIEQEQQGGADAISDDELCNYVNAWAEWIKVHGRRNALTKFLRKQTTAESTHKERLRKFKRKWPEKYKEIGLGHKVQPPDKR